MDTDDIPSVSPKKRIRDFLRTVGIVPFIITCIGIIFILTGILKLTQTVGSRSHSVSFRLFLNPVVPTPKPTGIVMPPPCTPITERVSVPILMYHYVEHVHDLRDTIRMSLDIYPETLEKQIITLQDAGYTFLTAGELGESLNCSRKLPAKPVLITFDDGYGDFYTDVLPILKRRNVKATVYMISGVVGHPNYMTMDQLLSVAHSGLVEIGSHTVHHRSLARLEQDVLDREVVDSRRQLEQMTGKPVVSFCYPNGSYDQAAEEAVRAAGYLTATTTKLGGYVDPLSQFSIPRIRPGNRIGNELTSYLETLGKRALSEVKK